MKKILIQNQKTLMKQIIIKSKYIVNNIINNI